MAAFAEGGEIRIQADLEYIYSDIETEERDTGEKIDTTFSYFKQKYNIDIQKEIYPYLYFRGGGFFELIDSTTDEEGSKTGFDETNRPSLGRTQSAEPAVQGFGSLSQEEFQVRSERLSPQRVFLAKNYSGFWKWTPVGFPTIDLEFNRFHTWDDDDNRDSVFNLYVAKSRYDYRDFSADYTYTRSDLDQSMNAIGEILDPGGLPADEGNQGQRTINQGSLTQIHNGGLRYSTDLFDDRLKVIGRARVNYDRLEPSGTGPVRPPTISPGAPFFLLDDSDPSTLTVVDAANPLGTVNIGRNAPLDPVAVGLDFGTPTEVDTIHVMPVENLLDPALASPGEIASVAGSFDWRVFISDDQLTWTEQVVDLGQL